MNARNDDDGRQDRPEYPRSTPEIIPPDHGGEGRRSHVHIWVAGRDGRMTLKTPSPFLIFLVLAIFALMVAAVLIVLLGAVLFWLPIIILTIAGLFLVAGVRQYWRRLQGWVSGR